MTRGEWIFRVSRELDLDDTVASDELRLMQAWANEAAVDVLLRTHCYAEPGDMVLTPNVSEYRTDSAILAIRNKRITSAAGRFSLEVVTMAEALELQNATLANDHPSKLAFEGNLMVVVPTPTTADTIRFIFVPKPTPMTNDAHDTSVATYGGIPSQFDRALETYGFWRGSSYDKKQTPQTIKDYREQYLDEITAAKREFRQMGQRGLNRARVGYPGRQGRVGRRNDVYPS